MSKSVVVVAAVLVFAGVALRILVRDDDAPAPSRRRALPPAAAAVFMTPSFAPVRHESVDPRQQFAASLAIAEPRDEPLPPADVIGMIEHGLAATGTTSEPWTRDAERAFGDLARDPIHVSVSNMRCFSAGCIATLELPPDADARAVLQQLGTTQAVLGWPGSKLASPSVEDGGHRASRLVLLRPDAL